MSWSNIKYVIETNFKGDNILKVLNEHKNYEEDMLLYTKHTDKGKYLSPGIRWNKLNKPVACQTLKFLIKNQQIFITEKTTYQELNTFGQDIKGNYKALGGHDDTVMTLVNLSQLFSSEM
jgi:hypothetical protein